MTARSPGPDGGSGSAGRAGGASAGAGSTPEAEPGRGLVGVFTAERPRLVGLAYRMTGSRLDAEDIVQEAWLRAQRVDWGRVERPAAWLTTVVSRLALDDLRSARRRRERYVGPWLAEPVWTPQTWRGSGRAARTTAVTGEDAGSWAGGRRRTDAVGRAVAPGESARSGGDAGAGAAAGTGAGDACPDDTGAGGADAAAAIDPRMIDGGLATDPAETVELAETLTFGFLRLLDALKPIERVVFLLADVFDTPYGEIAPIVDRNPEACRQIASRARRRVRDGHLPRHDPPDAAARLAVQLLAAVAAGDVDRTVSLLAEDVVLVSDGGPDVRAARRPVLGPDRVARFLVNVTRRDLPGLSGESEMTSVNGEPALLVHRGGRPLLIVTAEVSGGTVHAIYIVNSPTKLAALDVTNPMV